jgi:hypothetical protein
MIARSQHANVVGCVCDVPPRPWPAATRQADPSKLDGPRRSSQLCQCSSEIAHVTQAKPRQETPAVNELPRRDVGRERRRAAVALRAGRCRCRRRSEALRRMLMEAVVPAARVFAQPLQLGAIPLGDNTGLPTCHSAAAQRPHLWHIEERVGNGADAPTRWRMRHVAGFHRLNRCGGSGIRMSVR